MIELIMTILTIVGFLTLLYFSERAMNNVDENSSKYSEHIKFSDNKCHEYSIYNDKYENLDGKKVRIVYDLFCEERIIEGFLNIDNTYMFIYKNKDDERPDFICMTRVLDENIISIKEIK